MNDPQGAWSAANQEMNNAKTLSVEAASHGTRRWHYPIPRHERQQTGISARQQRKRRSAARRITESSKQTAAVIR
jgi:hypothetical protein